ncbi:peptidoglycan DD-metalloendopeptidase family protein [Arthrobacter sp. NPDC090010]|uniref:peptidoglycan DD-metalloendopeptidase family protein n=1 Tax=Arthrobacter sp. NPDC090010 TaxID=3363942 RepID=UPI0037F9FFD5
MSSAAELMVGYITIAAEGSQLTKDLGKAWATAESGAAKTGKAIGKALTAGAGSDIKRLEDDVIRAEQRVSAEAERSATKTENAKRKVQIAQLKLLETVDKYGKSSSQAMVAADRLSLSEQKFKAETLAAASAQNKLQSELDQSKKALTDARAASQSSAQGFATGWKGVGQRIASYAKSGVKQAGDEASAQAKKEGAHSGGLFSEAFKGAVAGLAAGMGLAELGRGIWDGIQGAGDLEQSIGAVDSVFKKSSAQIHGWAVNAKTDVGVSRNAFNELSALLGSQLKNAGTPMDQLADKTRELIGTGADLSSMFGGTTKDAIEAISSALKGEMDPIEKYGITLNQATLEATALSAGLLKPVKDSAKIQAATGKLELAQRRYNEAVRKSGADSTQALAAKNALASAEAGYQKAAAGSIPEMDSQTKAMAVQLAIAKQSVDAKGNFAREEDTFAHKQQVAAAGWEDVSAKIGERFLPIATMAMDFLGNQAVPAIDAAVMGLGQFGGWVQENAVWLVPLTAAIGGYVAVLTGLSIVNTVRGWLQAAAAAQWGLNLAMNANPIGLIVAGIAALVAGLVWFFTQTDLGREIVANAWAWIQSAIAGVVSWWNSTLIPVLQTVGQWFSDVWSGAVTVVQAAAAWIGQAAQNIGSWFSTYVVAPVAAGAHAVGSALTWLYTTIFQPIFGFIGELIRVWWQLVSGIFQLAVGFFQKVLGPAISALWTTYVQPVFTAIGNAATWLWQSIILPYFTFWVTMFTKTIPAAVTWLYQNAIQPIFTAIGNAVRWVWTTLLKPTFDAWGYIFTTVLPGVFRWFKTSIVDPIWNGISGTITAVWQNGIKPVFDTLGSFIRDKVAPAFRAGVDTVKKIWDGLIEVAKAPVRFVVNTVINDGLIGAFNSVAGWLKMDNLKIAPVRLPQGFAEGGWTGPGAKYTPAGVVHADEFVFTKEQTSRFGVGNMYALAGMLDHGYAGGGLVNPVRGAMPISQPWNPVHKGTDIAVPVGTPVYAALTGKVNWAGPGVQLPGIWGGNEIHINDGAREIWYAHLSQVGVKDGQMVRAGQRIGASGNTGISSGPHLHFGLFNGGYPNSIDPMRFLSGAQADGGGFNPIAGIVDGLVGKVKEAFPAGGFFIDLVSGFVKKSLNDVAASVGKMILGNSDGAAAGALYDDGGWLMPGTQIVTNATGRPEPVFTADQWDALKSVLAPDLTPAAPGPGSGTGLTVNGNVYGASAHEVVEVIERKARRAQAVYAVGNIR